MSGADEQARALFAREGQARLARLSELAASLDGPAHPDPGTLGEMSREAHALSQGAMLVGFLDVGRAVLALEEVLEQLSSRPSTVSGDLVDGLLAGLDGLRNVIGAAARGDPHARQADGLETALRGIRVVLGGTAGEQARGREPQEAVIAGQGDSGLTLAFRPPTPRATAPLENPDPMAELVRLAGEATEAAHGLGTHLHDAFDIDPMLMAQFRLLSTLLVRLQEEVGVNAQVSHGRTLQPCLVVKAGPQRYAVPLAAVSAVLPPRDAASAGGRPIIWYGDRSVPAADLAATLGIAGGPPAAAGGQAVVVLAEIDPHQAFAVDAVTGQRNLVVRELSPLTPRLEAIAGAALEPDGSALLVLDPPGLVARARQAASGEQA